MNKDRNSRLAIWVLLRFGLKEQEALAGDLMERLHNGQSLWWLWREILVAALIHVWTVCRRRWPEFGYALAGSLFINPVLGKVIGIPPLGLMLQRVRGLHWPLSMIYAFGLNALLATALVLLFLLPFNIANRARFGCGRILPGLVFTFLLFGIAQTLLALVPGSALLCFFIINLSGFIGLFTCAWASRPFGQTVRV